MAWSDIRDSHRNSVVKIRAVQRTPDPRRPYKYHSETVNFGTGFLVDLDKGYILTTWAVVNNPIHLNCSFQHMKGRTFDLKLISSCHSRNLALCQIPEADLTSVKNWFTGQPLNQLSFGDSYKIKELSQVLLLGYPDDSLRMQLQQVSGFKIVRHDKYRKDYDDVYRRDPSYVQIDAVHSSNMNGSPVIDDKGRVIAVVAKATSEGHCLAILSRTILSIGHQMTTEAEVKVPNISFDWLRTNRQLNQEKCGDASVSGIYVRNVYPDSLFDKMAAGDVIAKLDYVDPFWQSETVSFTGETTEKSTDLSCFFDRFGNVILNIRSTDPTNGKFKYSRCLDRILEISEVFDAIPYNSEIQLSICRAKKWYDLKAVYVPRKSDRIPAVGSRVESVKISGLVCTELTQTQLLSYPLLKLKALSNPSFWYGNRIIITQVLPGSAAENSYTLAEGDIVVKLNGAKVSTIAEVNKILGAKPEQLIVETEDGGVYIGPTVDSNAITTD